MKPDQYDSNATPDSSSEMKIEYDVQAVLEQLAASKQHAPEGFVRDVMAALTPNPQASHWRLLSRIWPHDPFAWLTPALAGALAAAAVVLTLSGPGQGPSSGPAAIVPDQKVSITFQLRAPDAEHVELLGSFNDWKRGEFVLAGPDATGYWQVAVPLPEGRHEYVFLVDGHQLTVDPDALIARPDGFGHMNSILEVGEVAAL